MRLRARFFAPLRTQNYQEAIRIAEEREQKLREAFDKCDDNRNGNVDLEEILPLLDELGLARRLKSDRIEFATQMFLAHDVDGSGELRCDSSRRGEA